MTQQTVRITEIIPPPPGTRQPWKFKDGNGLMLKTFSPQVGRVIQDHQGQPLLIDYETQVNGAYTDHIVKSATVPEPTPDARPAPTGSTWRPQDPAVERRIVRQSCLKAAVELGGISVGRNHDGLAEPQEEVLVKGVLNLADKFVEWVFEASPKNSGKVSEETVQETFPGAEKIGPKSRAR